MKMLLDINKLPIGDGREVLTSAACLKYLHKASHHVYILNKKSRTGIQEITRIFNFEV